jgi:hypothetical protein
MLQRVLVDMRMRTPASYGSRPYALKVAMGSEFGDLDSFPFPDTARLSGRPLNIDIGMAVHIPDLDGTR